MPDSGIPPQLTLTFTFTFTLALTSIPDLTPPPPSLLPTLVRPAITRIATAPTSPTLTYSHLPCAVPLLSDAGPDARRNNMPSHHRLTASINPATTRPKSPPHPHLSPRSSRLLCMYTTNHNHSSHPAPPPPPPISPSPPPTTHQHSSQVPSTTPLLPLPLHLAQNTQNTQPHVAFPPSPLPHPRRSNPNPP